MIDYTERILESYTVCLSDQSFFFTICTDFGKLSFLFGQKNLLDWLLFI